MTTTFQIDDDVEGTLLRLDHVLIDKNGNIKGQIESKEPVGRHFGLLGCWLLPRRISMVSDGTAVFAMDVKGSELYWPPT
jgi:hypothetical protein